MRERLIPSLVLFLLSVTSLHADSQEGSNAFFSGNRALYRLDLTSGGTVVVDRASGAGVLVPYGQRMLFDDSPKYSKDSDFIIRHVRAHAEIYRDWNEIAGLPVDFLRTGPYWEWEGKSPRECILDPLSGPHRFPDRADKVITAYVNLAEFSGIDGWDPSFDPAWDSDRDGIIDPGTESLPDYVDIKVFNAPWKNYVAVYWSDSWREEIRKKIDLVAAENFDGVMLDVMTCYWSWHSAYPEINLAELRSRCAELVRWISRYAKERYGTAFLITVNMDADAYEYFPDLGAFVDGGYYQNAFFRWDGSAVADGYGRTISEREYQNPSMDFMRSQGLSVLDMDHLGTGPVSTGLNFENYDHLITEANLLLLFRWAVESGSTPFVSPVFMKTPFSLVPRFSRVYPALPPLADTPYRDWVIGSTSDDVISTGDGDDLVFGAAGDDRINGGDGEDTALYSGSRNDYRVSRSGETVIVTARRGDEGTDVLAGVERLIFSNRSENIR